MATEPNFNAVPPVLLTADGMATGILQVTETAGFYFGMQCTIKNNLSSQTTVYIKRVVDNHTLWVGATKGGMDLNVDLSAYTVANGSAIGAAEQKKISISNEARLLATYETDPVNAWRTVPVDSYGNHYTDANPLPVAFDGDISIGVVEVKGTNGNFLEPNSDGSLDVDLNALNAFQTSQYSVGSAAVQLTPTPMPNRGSVSIKALTSSASIAIFIGNSSTVTVSTGYPLFNDDSIDIDLTGGQQIWAISTAVGQTACVLELA